MPERPKVAPTLVALASNQGIHHAHSLLGVDFRPYRIIGACNPTLALEVVQKEPHLGLLLPCNVVLYERDDGVAILGAIDPIQTLGAGAPAVESVARAVAGKLLQVLSAMD